MPRFYFDSQDGSFFRDEDGTDCSDLSEAKGVAARFVRELAYDAPPKMPFEVSVIVRDERVLFDILRDRQKLFGDNALRQNGFEFGKNQKDLIDRFIFGETLDDVVRDERGENIAVASAKFEMRDQSPASLKSTEPLPHAEQ